MVGTRGRTDSKHLMDASRGFTPPSRCSGALIAVAISRTECRFSLTLGTNKNTHLKGGCCYLVPEAVFVTE